MKVGVLELIAYTVPPEWHRRCAAATMRKMLYSIMPQAIAAWARRLGHRVHYATYYGQADPIRLLPDDLDVILISATTQASGLAYALARAYGRRGVRTVLGGPHAKCFPADAVRFFDIVVGDCDQELLGDILHRSSGKGYVSGRRPTSLPGVEERFADIVAAGFRPGRRTGFNAAAILGSLGCPYQCDFCTEWKTPYSPLSGDDLAADIRFLSSRHPGAIVAFHDPNFAVRFDSTMDIIETASSGRPNRYVMECSLSILKPDRLARLRQTNCLYVAPGVESWFDYGGKASSGGLQGSEKLEHVVGRFHELHHHVPGLQANFLFGSDHDRGREPADLTIEFIRRAPFVWPNVNIPTPYGGTPMFERYRAEGRILEGMPLACYCMPYLVTTLKHYDPVTFYRHLVRIQTAITSWAAFLRRVASPAPVAVRLAHAVQTLSFREQAQETRAILHRLETDRAFRAFHDGARVPVPEFYQRHYEKRLGRYAELISRADRKPVLDPLPANRVLDAGLQAAARPVKLQPRDWPVRASNEIHATVR